MNTPLKWHGGKRYLAGRMVRLMPRHVHYVEPFAGGLSVLLAKDPKDTSEVVNDLDGELTDFWRVLQYPDTFADFARIVEVVPFSQVEWEAAARPADGYNPVDRAVKFFVRCRQSYAGRMQQFATLSRTRTRRQMNEQASAWMTAVAGLPQIASRLRRVVILNDDALEVIRSQDGPGAMFYCDPPYLWETRTSPEVYRREMTEDGHVALLEQLNRVQGKVMLSGYPSALYTAQLRRPKWRRVDFDLPNHAAGGRAKRRMTECVWMNY
jgi:DNA adenine methylase